MWSASRSVIAGLVLVGLGTGLASAQRGDRRGEVQRPLPEQFQAPAAPPLPPEEAIKTIQVAAGFRLELFAAEPMVQDPVAAAFDEDGRLWVVEMRGFMPDIDGRGEDEPVGRVRVLEDADADGRADRASVFVEGLVLPRAVCPTRGGALFVSAGQLWFGRDTDGDGRADQRELIDADYATAGNVEHQPNGLLPALDNWIYNAKSSWRYRCVAGRWVKDKTEFRGQWGISQDNFGRLYYNVNFSQLHADLAPPNEFSRNPRYQTMTGLNLAIATDQRLYPIRPNTGVNRAYRPGILDERGRLREFTSASAPLVYRGDQFPADFVGNVFVCDPAANLVKRNVVDDEGLSLRAQPAYPDREFLASTDERFRPVNLALGPDGALYVVDMYRGIIQHRQFMTTHLRREILSRRLDQGIHFGRIYRVVHGSQPPTRAPKLSRQSTAELLQYLSHPNGWWRDTAQRLLIERGDRRAIAALLALAVEGTNSLGRLHALWTLEGLQVRSAEPRGERAVLNFRPLQDAELEALLRGLEAAEPKVQVATVRVLERLVAGRPEQERAVLRALDRLCVGATPEVLFQIALSLGNLTVPEAGARLVALLAQHATDPLLRDALLSNPRGEELAMLRELLAQPAWQASSAVGQTSTPPVGQASRLPAAVDQPPATEPAPATSQQPATPERQTTDPLSEPGKRLEPGRSQESGKETGGAPDPLRGAADEFTLQALASAVVQSREPSAVEALLDLIAEQRGALAWRRRPLLQGFLENQAVLEESPLPLRAPPTVLTEADAVADPNLLAMARQVAALVEWPGHAVPRRTAPRARPISDAERQVVNQGRQLYLVACSACHGLNGEGVPPLAPPLLNSEWVLGPSDRIIRIVLHGLEGPIHVNGRRYAPPQILPDMPALPTFDDHQLAATLSYVRRVIGRRGSIVTSEMVRDTRRQWAERERPWTEEELRADAAAGPVSSTGGDVRED